MLSYLTLCLVQGYPPPPLCLESRLHTVTIRSSLPSSCFQWVHWAEPWEFCELVGYRWCALLEREWKNTRENDLDVFRIGVILLAKGKTLYFC